MHSKGAFKVGEFLAFAAVSNSTIYILEVLSSSIDYKRSTFTITLSTGSFLNNMNIFFVYFIVTSSAIDKNSKLSNNSKINSKLTKISKIDSKVSSFLSISS